MKRGIYSELVTGDILMCMTGIGNVRSDYEKLIEALSEIAAEHEKDAAECKKEVCRGDKVCCSECSEMPIANKRYDSDYADFGVLELCAVPEEKERVKLSEAAGRICASSVIPYPPGIPIACPGEKITEELAEYIRNLRACGHKVIGVTENGEVTVGKENV